MMIGGLFWVSVVVVLYVYIGYPILIIIMSRLRAERIYSQHSLPSVTLLISACCEEKVIARKLENALSLNYGADKLQVLVGVDGDEDRTADIARSFAGRGVELDYSPERHGKTGALNRMIPQARGNIIVFSDANNLYEEDALVQLVKPFSDSTVGAVSGAKHISNSTDGVSFSEGLYWRYESRIKAAESRLGCCAAVCGEILAARRDLVHPLPPTVINDDYHIALDMMRQGFRVVYEPNAISVERASTTAVEEMIRRKRIVAGRMRAVLHEAGYLPWRRPVVLWQVVSHKFMRPLVPFGMLAAAIASVLTVILPRSAPGGSVQALTSPYNWIMLAAQVIFYATAWLGNHVEPGGSLGRLLYLPTFLVNSNLATLGGIWGSLTGSQTTLWERVDHGESESSP